jgi:hypothetical protein
MVPKAARAGKWLEADVQIGREQGWRRLAARKDWVG